MIDITLLGTAALLPLPERALTAAALQCGGRMMLFDCGEGTQTAARKAHVSLIQTDVIALTHYHGDHIFGLPGLLQTMYCMGREKPLWIFGPDGIEREMEPILRLAGPLPFALRLSTLPEAGVPLASLSPGWPKEALLRPIPTVHRTPSQGYAFILSRAGRFLPENARALGVPVSLWGRLQDGETVRAGDRIIRPGQVMGPPRWGLKFVFSGDTAACDSLERGAQDADLLICDATYGENGQEALAASHGHMIFAQAAALASRARVKRLWLVHYSQMIQDPELYLPNARAIYPEAVCGRDGMAVSLRFSESKGEENGDEKNM